MSANLDTAVTYGFQANVLIQNQNVETSQTAYIDLVFGLQGSNANRGPYIAINNLFAVDTTQDWTLAVTIQESVAGGVAGVLSSRTLNQYFS